MPGIDQPRTEVRTELDAFSTALDELEAAVTTAETAVSKNKLHGEEGNHVVERTSTAATQPPRATD